MTLRIFVPRDAAALSVGAHEVALAIRAEIEKHGIDAKIVRTGTRGMLFLEPLVEIETPAGRVGYGPVDVEDVAQLFAAGFPLDVSHPTRIGLVEQHPYFASQQRLIFARCGITDPLSIEEYAAHGGLKGLRKALAMAPADIVQQVTDSGLRGRGGAGFPTGIKWKTVLGAAADQKYIVCNADEGDSGTFADRMLMEGDPFTLI
ncbi:MAG: formate dehydrogenase, partial [Rhodospirillales bacterium]|nr:formate dehydrogenase [Rhodospirillales bacterium]